MYRMFSKQQISFVVKNTGFFLLSLHSSTVSPSHKCYSKSLDDDDPVSPAGPTRGYGGFGIFYRNDWDLKVVECPSGGNRICAVEVQSEPPLLVVSTYLPSRKYVTKTQPLQIHLSMSQFSHNSTRLSLLISFRMRSSSVVI